MSRGKKYSIWSKGKCTLRDNRLDTDKEKLRGLVNLKMNRASVMCGTGVPAEGRKCWKKCADKMIENCPNLMKTMKS